MSDGLQIRLNVRIEVERNYHNIHNFFYSKRIAVKPKNYDYYENFFQNYCCPIKIGID